MIGRVYQINEGDRNPALTQLELINRGSGNDRIYIRLLTPKNIPLAIARDQGMAYEPKPGEIFLVPINGYLTINGGGATFTRLKKCKDSGKWVDRSTYQDGFAYLHQQNLKGYGIYYIVNPGGRENGDITSTPTLFYECDTIGKSEQWDKVDELTRSGYQPTSVIETRNSLHIYLRISEQDVTGWRELQQRLIQRQDSDPSIHNENRLMRLPGFLHWQWNAEAQALESFPIALRLSTGNTFSRAELDSFLPKWDVQRWGKQPAQSERIETDPALNPWDIRNLATYLDGYNPDGRRGWITCKCPAHNGNSDNSLHIEQSSGAYKCHGGCDSKDVYRAALELSQSRGHQMPRRRDGGFDSKFNPFKWITKLKNFFTAPKSPFGFRKKDIAEPAEEEPKPDEVFEYPEGTRVYNWKLAREKGLKHLLDTSPPGTGKSYDAGTLRPEDFGTKRVVYISTDHRNAPTPTLINWPDLEARHPGLKRDEHGRLRRVKEGEAYSIQPNCNRNGTIGALRAKNIPGADTADLMCGTCPFLEACRGGHVFGFLQDRSITLKEPFFRAHPSSLPNVVSNDNRDEDSDDENIFDYGDSVLIWEEASSTAKATKTIEVTAHDIRRTISDLAVSELSAQQFGDIRPLLTTLLSHMDGTEKLPYYGLNHELLSQKLPANSTTPELIKLIRNVLTQDVTPLIDNSNEHGVSAQDLPAGVRKKFTNSDATTAARISKELALNWFPDFLDVWLDNELGSIRLDSWGNLIITVRDTKLAEIAQAAAFNIYLDGTAIVEDISKPLGITEYIPVTRVKHSPYPDTMDFIQIGDLGRLGNCNRAESTQSRIDAIINQIEKDIADEVPVFDFKKHTTEGDGKRKHFVDDRGFNDLEKAKALIIVGTPSENLGALEDEFTILYGRRPQAGTCDRDYPIKVTNLDRPDLQEFCTLKESADAEFAAFVRRRILATYHQEFGRLRAHRRTTEPLSVYVISNYPLDVPVELRRAMDITIDAASQAEQTTMAIEKAVQELVTTGAKVTQEAIARLAGVHRSTVSRAQKLCRDLFCNTGRVMHKNRLATKKTEPPPEDEQHISDKYLPKLSESTLPEIVQGVLEIFDAFGAITFRKIWDATPASTQIKLLQALVLCLDAGELRLLAKAAGVKL